MLSGQFLHSDSTMLVELMSQARETPEVPQHGLSLICKPPEAVEGTVSATQDWRMRLVPEGFNRVLQRRRALNEAFSRVSKVPFRLRKLAFAFSEPRLDKRSVAGRPKFVSPIFSVVMRFRACWYAELEIRRMCLGVRRFLSCVFFCVQAYYEFHPLEEASIGFYRGCACSAV